jgi:hypothetical protein
MLAKAPVFDIRMHQIFGRLQKFEFRKFNGLMARQTSRIEIAVAWKLSVGDLRTSLTVPGPELG